MTRKKKNKEFRAAERSGHLNGARAEQSSRKPFSNPELADASMIWMFPAQILISMEMSQAFTECVSAPEEM